MRLLRVVGTVLVLLALLGSALVTLARQVVTDPAPAVLAASFAPLGVPGYAVAGLGALLLLRGSRHRRALVGVVAAAAAGLALHVAWLLPDVVGEEVAADPDLSVLTLNIQLGEGDLDEVAALLDAERPEVAVLTEVTPAALRGLRERDLVGPGTPWPHLGGRALPGPRGTVVLSAWPLREEVVIPLGNSGYRMEVAAPTPFTLSAVHPDYPLSPAPWRADLATVASVAREVEGPHVVAGDLNATVDHAALREVLDAGLRDAAEQSGAGWQPTWPRPGADGVPGGLHVPLSLLRLDHVLVSPELVAVETRTAPVSDADHLALVADLAWR